VNPSSARSELPKKVVIKLHNSKVENQSVSLLLVISTSTDMAKRPADEIGDEGGSLKAGERPLKAEHGEEMEFEDEFEDEFESEDEIFEAGVDGRPDREREAEERRGTWITPKVLCEHLLIEASRMY